MRVEQETEIRGPERIWSWLLFWLGGEESGGASTASLLPQGTVVIKTITCGALTEGLGGGVLCGLHDFAHLILPVK